MSDHILHQAVALVEALDKGIDKALPHELANIVKFHSKGAAASALASAWIPGAGGAAAALLSAGFIWNMYIQIGNKIGLPFTKNILKSVASGVATNLASYFVGSLVLSGIFSIFVGPGSFAASLIMGATCYALTLASGYIYLKILTNLFLKKVDLSSISEQDLQNMANEAAKNQDVEEILKDAKKDFKRNVVNPKNWTQ